MGLGVGVGVDNGGGEGGVMGWVVHLVVGLGMDGSAVWTLRRGKKEGGNEMR